MPRKYWTKDRVLAEAKKFNTIKEWKANSPLSYNASTKQGWNKEMSSHMTVLQRDTWTKESVIKEAKKHKTVASWRKASESCYNSALRNGWKDEAISHMTLKRTEWTKQEILADAKKYKTKKEWRENSRGAYKKANEKRWMLEASANMETLIHKGWTKDGVLRKGWTKEEILKEAKKYKTKKEWKANSSGTYAAAAKYHWIDGASSHMTKLWEKKWTKEAVLKDAQQYKYKSDWKKSSPNAYTAAVRQGWLDEATKHMELQGSKFNRCIYSISVMNTKLIYIGLTFNYKKRISKHLKSKRFIKIAKKYGPDLIVPEQISDYMPREKASQLEQEYIDKYAKKGYKLLNISKGGALGGSTLEWTKERVLNDAIKYKTIMQWHDASVGAYESAKRNNWFEEATQHMKIFTRKPWTKEEVIIEARKFNTKNEWRNQSLSSYPVAHRKGWVTEASAHMKPMRKFWSKENVLEEAKKYTSTKEWRQNSISSYEKAKKMGWFEEAINLIGESKK